MSSRARADRRDAVERVVAAPLRRVLGWGRGVDGRIVLLAAVAAYLGAVAAGRLLWGVDLWPRLGVPPSPSLFFDARNVTAAWECQRLGYDPLYENPCDPTGRPLNYLRPWLLLGVLGLDQSHTFAFAAVLIAALFATFCLVVGRVSAGAGVVLALAACSPAVMFAVERANMDIALFSVLALAALVWRALPGPARVLSPLLVLAAAAAKVYPGFALAGFVVSRSRLAARTGLACLAAFAAYLAYSLADVAQIAQIAPQGEHWSYGARILPAHLYHQVGADRWAGPAALKQLIAVVPVLALAGAAALWARRRLAPAPGGEAASASLLAFHLGVLVYLGTFAAGNNYDYRLVFLLLTLPQLLAWAGAPRHRLGGLAAVTLVAVVALLWLGSLSHALSLGDEVASWAVAGLFAALAAATVPPVGDVLASLVGRRRAGVEEGQ